MTQERSTNHFLSSDHGPIRCAGSKFKDKGGELQVNNKKSRFFIFAALTKYRMESEVCLMCCICE